MMMFDRFSFREREGRLSSEEPIAELASEREGYSLTLGVRQIVFLIAGYCFLCVLVFALGVVVGRAVSGPELASEARESTGSLVRDQPPTTAQDVLAHSRSASAPEAAPKIQPTRESESPFSPAPPEVASPSKPTGSEVATRRAKSPMAPEGARSGEPPPTVVSKTEEKRESEPRRAVMTDTKPMEPAVSRPSPRLTADYTIQVSAFRSLEQASELKGRLSKKGYGAYVQSVDLSDKGTWYRVRVGGFRDKERAERMAGDLRTRENLPAVVTSKSQ